MKNHLNVLSCTKLEILPDIFYAATLMEISLKALKWCKWDLGTQTLWNITWQTFPSTLKSFYICWTLEKLYVKINKSSQRFCFKASIENSFPTCFRCSETKIWNFPRKTKYSRFISIYALQTKYSTKTVRTLPFILRFFLDNIFQWKIGRF